MELEATWFVLVSNLYMLFPSSNFTILVVTGMWSKNFVFVKSAQSCKWARFLLVFYCWFPDLYFMFFLLICFYVSLQFYHPFSFNRLFYGHFAYFCLWLLSFTFFFLSSNDDIKVYHSKASTSLSVQDFNIPHWINHSFYTINPFSDKGEKYLQIKW